MNGKQSKCEHTLVEVHETPGVVSVKCIFCPYTRSWPLTVYYLAQPVRIGSRFYPVTADSDGVNICADCSCAIYAGSVIGIPAGNGEDVVGHVWFHRYCAPDEVRCDRARIEIEMAADIPEFAI